LGIAVTNHNSSQEEMKQIEVRECFLLFSAEYFVLQFAVQEYKDEDNQNSNFACFV